MWLGDRRGHLVDWTTQRWVQVTGRRISLADHQWLDGPAGKPTGIGSGFFERYASEHGLQLQHGTACGLLPDFSRLRGEECDPNRVSPDIVDFYERTSEYDLDAWSHWCGAFRPFGSALAVIFSRRLQQLNVPLSGLDTSRGLTSQVVPCVRHPANEHMFTAWVRQLAGSGNVVYAGAYSLARVPQMTGCCVRVVFPLPNGNAVVIMKPVAHADGSLTLISAGSGFGAPGFYFTVHDDDVVWTRYLKAMRETIHVYSDADGEVRADHVLRLWGATFLRIHYRARRRRPKP